MSVVSEKLRDRSRGVLVLKNEYKNRGYVDHEAPEDIMVKRIAFAVMNSWISDYEVFSRFCRRFSCSKLLQSKLSASIACNLFESLGG